MVCGRARRSLRRTRRAAVTASAMAVVIGSGIAVRAAGTAAVDRGADQALAKARHFTGYRLFYLGPQFEGYDLSDVGRELVPPAYHPVVDRLPRVRVPRFDFIYGSCTPSGGSGGEGGTCVLPIQLQNDGACALHPHSIARPTRRLMVRGVPAQLYSDHGAFDQLVLFTKTTTITIFDAGGLQAALHVAQRLRSLDGTIEGGAPLPKPTRAGLEGRLRCQSSGRPTQRVGGR